MRARVTRRAFWITVILVLIAAASAAAASSVRHFADQPDDFPGASQVHLVYAVPRDGTDAALDTNGTLRATVGSWEGWLAGQTGGRRVRLDTAIGQPDITFVRLGHTDAQLVSKGVYIRDEIERELRARGFDRRGKVYAVYYGGSVKDSSCGTAPLPPEQPGPLCQRPVRRSPSRNQ
ncbi:MAG: hypothetical protein M3Z50_13830 [Actinomycetota bacterium]|nr:hypothetical protein [Actinomycetota bacterium]